jgi:hypothetical protein
MIDFIFKGTINVDIGDKNVFLEDFNKFLNSKKASFKGTIEVREFEDAEVVDD